MSGLGVKIQHFPLTLLVVLTTLTLPCERNWAYLACLLTPGHLLFVIWGLDPDGLGWVTGPEVYLTVGWIGLGQLFGGLGWVCVDEMDPWTTVVQPTQTRIPYV